MYIVTGVSRGIGQAVAELYLERGKKVLGIGRSHNIEHENFEFVQMDLASDSASEVFGDRTFKGEVSLINNAGILGSVRRLSEQTPSDIASVLQVNTIAAMDLALHVYQNMEDPNKFRLVNISSGAALRPIPSWAAYCASKAALNMLSEAFYLEEQEKGRNIAVYAVAPGVIDTDMQAQIRSASQEEFSAVQRFKDLKSDDQLFTSRETAERLEILLKQPYSGEVICDLRDLKP